MKWSEYMSLQIEEIHRYRWIESEKAGRDVGRSAALEWIDKHADEFRRYVTQELGETIEAPVMERSSAPTGSPRSLDQ